MARKRRIHFPAALYHALGSEKPRKSKATKSIVDPHPIAFSIPQLNPAVSRAQQDFSAR
jgi:hypothetical protein